MNFETSANRQLYSRWTVKAKQEHLTGQKLLLIPACIKKWNHSASRN
jgi:hypothetical protein